ncbi:MAG: YjbQ family protein, partial [Pseudomonadota bacterium]|nr:YjbQ family protein [Pseudomonadota bacterium]
MTDSILKLCTASKIRNGLINLNILHTSASIIIQENADKNVLTDLLYYFKN